MTQERMTKSPEKMKQRIAHRESCPASAQSLPARLHPNLHQQGILGNQPVAYLLQAKLAVSQPGDRYERDADRVAEQITSMPSPGSTPTAQRQMMPEEEEDKQPLQTEPLAASILPLTQQEQPLQMSFTMQRAAGGESLNARPSIEQQLGQTSDRGSPLPESVRSYMEPRFGADFTDVRVHVDSDSTQLNRSLNARAFTIGRDIYYGAGKLPADLHLTAHELTHVVQQDGETLHRAQTQVRDGAAAGGNPSGREGEPVSFLSAATNRRATHRMSDSWSTPNYLSPTSSLHRLHPNAGNAAATHLIQADRGSSDKLPTPAVPFPGVFVPGYEPLRFFGVPFVYTEKDRDALVDGLEKRRKENGTTMARFLGTYVEATIDIWGRYVSSEMSDTAIKSGSGLAAKLLKFVVTQSLAFLAGGGVGAVFRPLAGKVAGKVLGALADKVTDFTGGLVTDSMQNDLLASDVKKRQQALDKINASLAAQTGEFVTIAVESVLVDDSIDRMKWVLRAPLTQLDLFRIPEAIPAVDKDLIRSVVAGVIAAKAHQHDADKPCDSWGLQCGIAETVPQGSVGELDDNVVKIGLKPAGSGLPVNYIRFFSASPVLAKELAQKAQLRMVPKIALRVEVDRGDDALAAAAILAAAGFAQSSDSEAEERFMIRYEQLIKQSGRDYTKAQTFALLTRNPEFGLRIAGVGLAESLWLYELASGDPSLTQLADSIERRHMYEQEHVISDTIEPVSLRPSASRLAELTNAVIEPMLLHGVEKLIMDNLGGLVLPNVEPKGRRVAR
jgi:hypothetical protein